MQEKKYFPIKTDTACQLKWTWSTVFLYNSTTNSCHRVNPSPIPGNFNLFHNTEKKLQDRRLMLQGQWPSGGCEYCQNIELAGGQSDRLFQLDIPNLTPPELDTDLTAIEVTPRILEVYFDNVCNMSCIYCWDGFSSRIQQENEKFGVFESNGIKIANRAQRSTEFDKHTQEFWNWIEQNHNTLRRLHILGGEPFYQPQFDVCLNFLETHSSPDLEFNIVSNLKVPHEKFKNFIGRIKKIVDSQNIKRFDLTCSIDCWSDEQEYIRYGINMDNWRKNFEFLVNQKWIVLNINQTITGLGIKSIPSLVEYINSQRQDREIGHYFMACVNRSYLYPGIFGPGFFDQEFDKILNVMPNDTWQHQHAYNMMRGLQLEFNNSSRNDVEIKKLITFLDEIDRRRNLNWKKTFPWLEREINNVV